MKTTNIPRKSVVLVLACLAVSGCASTDVGKPLVPKGYLQSTSDRSSQSVNESLPSTEPEKQQSKTPRPEYITGTGRFTKKTVAVSPVKFSDGDQVTLTFKNTDIRILIRAVLADTLGLKFTIDPRVDGKATLETSGPIGKEALQMTLEALLKTKGYALVPTSDGYFILPVSEAPRAVVGFNQTASASSNLPGFSVQVVTLKYTVPSEMALLLEPFAPSGGILRSDDSRNLILLAGTSQELASMLRAIETFDVSRMAGMSFAIFPLQYVEADKIVPELEEIFSGLDKTAKSNIHFIPIPRVNRLVAVAPSHELLKSVETWIGKLDLGGSAPGRRIYVYQVKNGRAQDIASTLNLIIGTRNAGYNRGSNNSLGNDFNQNNGNRNRSGARGSNFAGGAGQAGQRNRFDVNGQDTIRIVPSEENNSLLIMATPTEFGVVESALRQIDVSPRQVLIELTLAEITLNDELRRGLQWHFETGNNSVTFGSSTSPSAILPGFSWGYTSSSGVSAVLNTLETLTDVKVISSPKILVLNNQTATLQVGDEIPVPTSTAVSSSDSNAPIINTIQYRNTGIILTVTPRINDSGLVMLDIEQEISNVVETASSGIDAPTVQQRKISSSIAVQNGATIALGGLIRNTLSKNNSGIPFLKDIPLLGNAFKSDTVTERRSELIVLLTPRVIRNVTETREAMDYLEREFQSLFGSPIADEE